MVVFIEFKAHIKLHPGKFTPTGVGKYDGVEDFIKFIKERDLSIVVTDRGSVYGIGDDLIVHLDNPRPKDVDRIESAFRKKLHWPFLVAGYDPRVNPRLIGKTLGHFWNASLHEIGLRKGRREKEW